MPGESADSASAAHESLADSKEERPAGRPKPLTAGLPGTQLTLDTEDTRVPVKVIRSDRRKKSSAARFVNGVIEVRIPSWLNKEQEREQVESLRSKVEQKLAVKEAPVDLAARARKLAAVYDLPVPQEIRWVTNQVHRWASCSYNEGVIRMSSRLIGVPDWVLDYVILHELTHLVEADHGPEFHRLMDRYPKVERAEGFLDAMSLGFFAR